ncbi:O-antigen ligase family protein [Sphingopyxis sp. L1A2A]|uniref:O-antigen ligase family protein n=1 Tax=Sphingopyxis sp. L1A2A TaxID=2502247 RepID=UPI001485413B|nr:O-antigen ligase family protein [Sphingopyxis sp. L1A2A]
MAEHNPLLKLWARLRDRREAKLAVARANLRLGGYASPTFAHRHRKKLLFLFGLALFFYSMTFTLIGRFMVLQFLTPLMLMILFVIWMLPEARQVPTRWLGRLGIAFMIALLCWPDYLALALPGLPWLTAIRIVTVPLALVMLFCLSGSRQFRAEMKELMTGLPIVWQGVVAFAAIALISIVFSSDIGLSVNKFVVAQLTWTLPFFVAIYVFRQPNRATQFGYFLWAIVLFVCLIAIQEWRHSVVPWAGNIPSFLKIEDESVQRILSGSSRAATGIYRVQSKFTTPLGFAEFLALSAPFILHIMMRSKNVLIIVAAALTLALQFWCIRLTDSRLGVVGFFMTLLLYMLVWGGLRWYRDRDSLFGPAVVIAYPITLSAFFAATLFVGRLNAMVWGTGAQQFSTESRKLQVAMGLPKIFKTPWGNGIGRGAEELGFTNLAGILTIDTYYLLVALEFGILGFLIYFGMIIATIVGGGKQLIRVRATDTDGAMLAPLLIALTNFLVIKSIFSQQENHALAFVMMGAVVVLAWRIKQQRDSSITVLPPTVSPPKKAQRSLP